MNQHTVTNNNDPQADWEKFEPFEQEVRARYVSREARRKRKPKIKHEAKKSEAQILAEIAEVTALEGGFNPTYRPALHEESWILAALQDFYEKELIIDVLSQVKGGKEANVYCCRAHPSTGVGYLAAKIYRPRMFRNLRNDAAYRQGRRVVGLDGKEVKGDREFRAIKNKTGFGASLQHQSWMRYEFDTLKVLYEAGASVPKPWLIGNNAILMGYVGEGVDAAPTLNSMSLERASAELLFDKAMTNIDLMLRHSIVHGDLSPFNILYWDGDITLIDFPQAIDPYANPNVYDILRRDVVRVCDYFRRQGVAHADGERLFERLWRRYLEPDAAEREAFLAEESRLLMADEDDAVDK